MTTNKTNDAVEIPEGATHVDMHGDYWKIISKSEAYFYMDRWVRYAFNHNDAIEDGYITCIK